MNELTSPVRGPSNFSAGERLAETFRRDGVVLIKNAFDEREMQLIEAAFDWRFAHPNGHGLRHFNEKEGAPVFFQEVGNSHRIPVFEQVLRQTKAAALTAELFGSGPVWFEGEQLFFKDSRNSSEPARRTPWHQDGSYLPFGGEKIAIMWIPLMDLPQGSALEVVRGSHKGPTYDGMPYDPNDDTTPLYNHPDFPRLPDIQKHRDDFDIFSEPVGYGDALVFHMNSLHGGGPALPGMYRRSLTLRFFGDDAKRVFLPMAEWQREWLEGNKAADQKGEESPHAHWQHLQLGEKLHQAKAVRMVHPWTD